MKRQASEPAFDFAVTDNHGGIYEAELAYDTAASPACLGAMEDIDRTAAQLSVAVTKANE